MTLKSDAKFKEKLTCAFKYDMRNWVNFHLSSQKSENCTMMGSFCPKHILFQLQNFRGIMCHDTEGCRKVYMKTDLRPIKMTRNLVNFMQAVESLKICTLIGSVCPKYTNI